MKLLDLIRILLLLASPVLATAQYSTASLDLGGELTAWYDQAIGKGNSGLYEGAYSPVFYKTPTSHVFLTGNTWKNGSMVFRNQRYDQVNMMYDIFADIVIIQNDTHYDLINHPIKLSQDQISSFRMEDAFFQNYQSGAVPPYGNGFYEILFQGDCLELIVKRRKEEVINSGELFYVENHKYYIFYEGQFHEITNKKSFLKLFKPYKKGLRKYVRVNSLARDLVGSDIQFKALARQVEQKLAAE